PGSAPGTPAYVPAPASPPHRPDPRSGARRGIRFGRRRRTGLEFSSVAGSPRGHADVAQLVAHHLAKVRVAGSNPVVRSEAAKASHPGGVAERRGNGLQSRVHGFKSRLHLSKV